MKHVKKFSQARLITDSLGKPLFGFTRILFDGFARTQLGGLVRILRNVFARILFVGFALTIGSCASNPKPSGSDPWSYSTPEQQGFDSEVLIDLLETIEAEERDIHSIILMRRDHVFFEFYNYPYGPETLQYTASVGKSVLSALVGIALENGQLDGLDTPILDSFPEYKSNAVDPAKARITLRDALTMQAGLDAGDDTDQALEDIVSSNSWIESTWQREMIQPSGQGYNYSSFVSHLISQVTERAIDDELSNFARRELLDLIGIEQVLVDRDPQDQWFGAGPLWMSARDMLRFGRLYLEKGKWNGEQIVPKQWVKDSTRNQIGKQPASTQGIKDARYGYHWWVFDGAYAAIGAGGQMIMVVPELDLVAVVTRADPDFDVTDDYLLKALKSVFWKAKANPTAVAELDTIIESMGKPVTRKAKPAQKMAKSAQKAFDYQLAIASDISGQRFELITGGVPDAVLAYRSFTLNFENKPNLSSVQFETDSGNLEVLLGPKGAPLFTDRGERARRPDKISQLAASTWWTDDNELVMDFHEVGFPIKERWHLTFVEQEAVVTIKYRGAAVGEWSYVARQ